MAKKKSKKETPAEGRMWPGAINKQTREQVIKNRRTAGKRNQGRKTRSGNKRGAGA